MPVGGVSGPVGAGQSKRHGEDVEFLLLPLRRRVVVAVGISCALTKSGYASVAPPF